LSTVPYLDVKNGKIVQIPKEELAYGYIYTQVVGFDSPVWIDADYTSLGTPISILSEEQVQRVGRIHRVFSPFLEPELDLDQFLDCFCRDRTPEHDIKLWERAVTVFVEKVPKLFEAPAEGRAQKICALYHVLLVCMMSTPDTAHSVLPTGLALDKEQVDVVIARFFELAGTNGRN